MIIHEIQIFLIFLIKKVIGKMKDAFKGEIINKFVGLKSKKYPLVSVYGKENKKK